MRRFGKYLLLDKISTGGMADVYRAKLVGIRGFTKTLAIKRIHPHLLERTRFLRMFTDEAKIASRLVHPNIVQIYDLGEEEGIPYIAMEYVPGRDLFRVVQKLVADLASMGDRLLSVMLFGSMAQGTASPGRSDIDATVFLRDAAFRDRETFLTTLETMVIAGRVKLFVMKTRRCCVVGSR